MNNQEAMCELGLMIGFFQTQFSIKEAAGTLEDGEPAMFARRFEALHQGMAALGCIDTKSPYLTGKVIEGVKE